MAYVRIFEHMKLRGNLPLRADAALQVKYSETGYLHRCNSLKVKKGNISAPCIYQILELIGS